MIKIKNQELLGLWRCPELEGGTNKPHNWIICCSLDNRLSQLENCKEYVPIKWSRSKSNEPVYLIAIKL